MGRLLDEILRRVRRQLDRRGLVLWFDPEARYAHVVDILEAEGVPVQRGTRGYLALRRAIDPWLDAESRPTGLAWVPGGEEEGRTALCELAAVASVMSPKATTQLQNTGLGSALRASLPEEIAEESRRVLLQQAESGHFSVEELDGLVSQAGDGARAALAVVLGTADPAELALRLLAGSQLDEKIVAKGLTGSLADAIQGHVGGSFSRRVSTPSALREAVALHALSVAWRARYGSNDLPARDVQHCESLLETWRDRLGARDEYVRQVRAAQALLGAVPAQTPLSVIEADASFEASDDELLARVEKGLDANPADPSLEAICRAAQGRFWSQAEPLRMERWALVESVAHLLRIERLLSPTLAVARGLNAEALSARYTSDGPWGGAWSDLDTGHRHMEKRFHDYDLDPKGADARLEQLVTSARQRYAAFVAEAAELWLRAVAATTFSVPGTRTQREIFARYVRPRLGNGPVAYLLVDGLRFEMARELRDAVRDLGGVSLEWTLGTLPSITEVGMAALMPGAEDGATLEGGRDGRLGLVIKGQLLRTRAERMAHLQSEIPRAVVLKLGDVIPSKRGIREKIATAPLVVVTVTDELDGLGDGVNPEMARRLMDDTLVQVRRAVKVLFQLGVRHAVVTSDHGHLFGETIESDRQIPAPGGQTVDMHPRAWIGRGGAAHPAHARLSASHLGLGGDLEVAVPWSTGCFASSGATGEYFHGGGSPQELIVPVLVVESSVTSAMPVGTGNWTLTPSRPKLSSLVATVIVGGEADGLFTDSVRRVRIEVRDGRKVIGRPTAAAYGFDGATGELALEHDAALRSFRANTVTVRLEEAPKGSKVRVVMLDARTDHELAHAELEVVIATW